MGPAFDTKDLARYPFLQEAQAKIAGSQLNQLETFLSSEVGSRIIERAAERIEAAITISSVQALEDHFLDSDKEGNALESLYTYGMARIIASCINDRSVIDRLISLRGPPLLVLPDNRYAGRDGRGSDGDARCGGRTARPPSPREHRAGPCLYRDGLGHARDRAGAWSTARSRAGSSGSMRPSSETCSGSESAW